MTFDSVFLMYEKCQLLGECTIHPRILPHCTKSVLQHSPSSLSKKMQRHDSQERYLCFESRKRKRRAWERGRPLRPRLLRLWPRARRDTRCVLQNGVVDGDSLVKPRCQPATRRGLTSESPSTSLGSVVTANVGATDTFEGHSNTAYRNWIQAVQPSAASHEYASFINAKVADHENGVWTTGIVQCLHQGILPSRTRTLPADSILPNKSQPFSIVWADDNDSICDLPLLLTYLDNHASKSHRADATRSPATGGRARRASNGAAAPSSLPSSSPIPQPPFFASNAPPSASPAPTAGIFHSR